MTREEAIYYLENTAWLGTDEDREKTEEAVNIAVALLQKPEQGWIPCSERLPEDVEVGEEYPNVIFCTQDESYTGFYENCTGKWWTADGDGVCYNVVAWMPLPEPWKEEQE